MNSPISGTFEPLKRTYLKLEMFCTQCGKRPTKQKSRGVARTINSITKICNECEATLENGSNTLVENVSDGIPEEIANKTGAELSATDIYTIVTSAVQCTNKKIDDLKKNVSDDIELLQNRVKILEIENERKDEEISTLKRTVINIQKALIRVNRAQKP